MPKYFISFFLFLLFFEKNIAQSVVRAEKMDVLFVGYDNIVSVAVDKTVFSELAFQVNNGEVKPFEKNKFNIVPEKSGILKFTILNKERIVGEHFFSRFIIKRIPEITVILAVEERYAKGGDIPTNVMKATKGLGIDMGDFYFNIGNGVNIQSFTFTLLGKNDDPITCENRGATFGDFILKILANAKAGDKVYFDEINVRTPGDEAGQTAVNSLVFTLK